MKEIIKLPVPASNSSLSYVKGDTVYIPDTSGKVCLILSSAYEGKTFLTLHPSRPCSQYGNIIYAKYRYDLKKKEFTKELFYSSIYLQEASFVLSMAMMNKEQHALVNIQNHLIDQFNKLVHDQRKKRIKDSL